jgi:hypothetical protein
MASEYKASGELRRPTGRGNSLGTRDRASSNVPDKLLRRA